MTIVRTEIKCRIPKCPGTILKETSHEQYDDPMPGESSRNKGKAGDILYCSRCGVQYHKMPTT